MDTNGCVLAWLRERVEINQSTHVTLHHQQHWHEFLRTREYRDPIELCDVSSVVLSATRDKW